MARPRQPVELLLIKGKKHLTKAEIEERQSTEVKAAADNVKPPGYLPQELKKEFKKISDELLRINLMTNLDVDALARFLLAREQYLKVTEILRVTDPVVEDPESGAVGPSITYEKLLISQDKLFKQCRASASDLGLTISSRCRLVIPKKEDDQPKSEEERLFGESL